MHGPKFALLCHCNVESIRDDAQAVVNRRWHIAHLTQKIGAWRRTTESKLMSMFGNIGPFLGPARNASSRLSLCSSKARNRNPHTAPRSTRPTRLITIHRVGPMTSNLR